MADAIEKADWLPRLPKDSDLAGWVSLRRTGVDGEWLVFAVAMLIVGFIFFGSAGGAIVRAIRTDAAISDKAAISIGLGVTFAAVAIVVAAWEGFRRRRGPRAHVRADRPTIELGGSARIIWQIKARPAWLRRLRKLSVLAEAAGPGTTSERFVVTRRPLEEKSLLSEIAAGPTQVTIPRDAMHSLDLGPVCFQWAVVLRGELEGAAEPWEQHFEMVVVPAPPGRAENWSPDPEAVRKHEDFDLDDEGEETDLEPLTVAPAQSGQTPAVPRTRSALRWLKGLLLVPLIVAGVAVLMALVVVCCLVVLPVVGMMGLAQKLRYGRRELKLGLDSEHCAYAPGETVKGWAEWKIDRPPRELVVKLRWNSGVGPVAEVRLKKPQKQERREFALTLPAGPYSCSGNGLNINWTVELSGAGCTQWQWIAVSPTGRTLSLEPIDRNAGEADAPAPA